MTTFHVPYHQDQRLPDGTIPTITGATTIDATLPDGTVWQKLHTLYDTVADAVAADIHRGNTPTVVSGDCLIALATITGVQRAGLDPAVIWFDAHGDIHTLHTSTSGYLGGMALRLAMGAHAELLTAPLGLRPVPESRAVLVDARDLDPAEAAYLHTSRITHRTVHDDTHLPEGPLVVHVDLDVIDSAELPNLLFPAPNGPTTDAVLQAIQRVRATGRVAALNIACPWHPPGDEHDTAIRTRLLTALTQPR